jgi:hypothetical protein
VHVAIAPGRAGEQKHLPMLWLLFATSGFALRGTYFALSGVCFLQLHALADEKSVAWLAVLPRDRNFDHKTFWILVKKLVLIQISTGLFNFPYHFGTENLWFGNTGHGTLLPGKALLNFVNILDLNMNMTLKYKMNIFRQYLRYYICPLIASSGLSSLIRLSL